RPAGDEVRSRRARRHGLGRDEAGHARDRLHAQRAALHQRGRRAQDRYADRRVPHASGLMDVDKLKAILAALKDTDVSRITWVEGTERLDIRLGHPPAPTTAVHAMAMPSAAPAAHANPPPPSPAAAAPAPVAPAVKKADD